MPIGGTDAIFSYAKFFFADLRIAEKMYNLLGNTQLVVGNLPIISKFEKELDSLKKVMSEDLHQAILRLIREDNYKTVPKLRKEEEC